jgi:hypothetical protein
MAWTLTAQVSAGSTDSKNVTTAGIDTTGARLLVAIVSSYGPQSVLDYTVSDNKGNVWGAVQAFETGNTCIEFWAVGNGPTVGAGHTFTITSPVAATFPSVAVAAFASNGAGFSALVGATLAKRHDLGARGDYSRGRWHVVRHGIGVDGGGDGLDRIGVHDHQPGELPRRQSLRRGARVTSCKALPPPQSGLSWTATESASALMAGVQEVAGGGGGASGGIAYAFA